MPNSSLIFRFCNCIFIFQHSNMFLFDVGNKIFFFFVSLKKEVILFWMRVHFKGGERQGFSKILKEVLNWITFEVSIRTASFLKSKFFKLKRLYGTSSSEIVDGPLNHKSLLVRSENRRSLERISVVLSFDTT